MEITFKKEGNKHVATFEVTNDFNLHVEKSNGELLVGQSGVLEGKYEDVPSLKMSYYSDVMDKDITALVYPKYIKITSYTEDIPVVVVTVKE